MAEKSPPRPEELFKKKPLLFKHFSQQPESLSNQFIVVFDSGEICLFSLSGNPDSLIFYTSNNNSSAAQIYSHEQKKPNFGPEYFNEIIPISQISPPKVFLKLELISNKSLVHAELSHSKKYLLIYGFIHENVPSLGVFSIQNESIKLIFSDAILGVSDATFMSPTDILISLPRCLTGCISFLSLLPDPPQHFQHRLIPRIIFAGQHTPRMTRITSSPSYSSQWHFATWNNGSKSSIGIWRMTPESADGTPRLKYIETVLQPCIDIFIYDVKFSPNGDSLFILLQGDVPENVYGWIWELKQDCVVQHNFIVPCPYESIFSVQWASETQAEIISKIGIFTVDQFGVSSAIYDKPAKIITARSEVGGFMYTLLDDGIPRVLKKEKDGGIKVLNLISNSDTKVIQIASVTLFKLGIKGVCDSIVGMHLYRCASCKMPLLYPLISRSEDGRLECVYCSRKCQEKHWPTYVAIHKHVFFEDEME